MESEHPQIDVDALLSDVAGGDPGALEFCRAYFAFAHLTDDAVDQQVRNRWTMSQVSNTCLRLAAALSTGFFQAHKDYLIALIEMSTLAYLESEEAAEGPAQRFLATEYFNVLLGVARIVGGFDHARAVAARWRFARG